MQNSCLYLLLTLCQKRNTRSHHPMVNFQVYVHSQTKSNIWLLRTTNLPLAHWARSRSWQRQ